MISSNSFYVKATTDVIGIGASLNPDGSFLASTGPTIQYVTADPNGVVTANAGSLALRSNGTLYINTTGGTVWVAVGGGGGASYPDNVAAVFGTTAPLQGTEVFLSPSNIWSFSTGNVSQATLQASASIFLSTGSSTITGAIVGGGSGAMVHATGNTDCTNAGGTGGDTGTVSIISGNATSTLGVSGGTGKVRLITGASDDGSSGDIELRTGTAGGTRGVIDINSARIDVDTQATDLRIGTNAVALRIGTSGTPGMQTFDTVTPAITFSAGLLTNLPQAVVAIAPGVPGMGIWISRSYNAGASNTDFALPARTGGWRVVDAYIRSDGATGGTLTVQTAGGAASVTDAMVPGNANVITRAAQVINANATFASGATVRLAVGGGAPAGEAFLRIEPR